LKKTAKHRIIIHLAFLFQKNMKHFFTKEKITGLYLEDNCLWKAHISGSLSKIEVETLEKVPTEGVALPPTQNLLCAALPAVKTLMRPLTLSLVKPKEIEATFIHEAEPLFPFALEESIVDKIKISASKTETRLQVLATQKQDIAHYLEELQEISCDPEVLCPKAIALSHFAKQFLPEKEDPFVIIDISQKETCSLLVQGDALLSSRALPNGLDIFGKEPLPTDETLENIHSYLREVARILISFQYEEPKPLIFTGPIAEQPALIQLITSFLKRPQALLESRVPLSFAVPVGAALSAIFSQKKLSSCNLRKGEFAFTKSWSRWKKETIAYLCLMLAVSSSLLFLGNQFLEKQKAPVVEKYLNLLAMLHINPNQEELGINQIFENLELIEQDLGKQTQDMPLHADVPRVSDLLAWLITHPQIAGEGKAIKLESLAYTMSKRPEKGKLKEHYQVKVDLEFSAPNATQAREFHDSLLTPNAFIDPKSELKWSTQKGRWRASFILKDKTQYPQATGGT
jgi:type IV pilus assembly protein PilM